MYELELSEQTNALHIHCLCTIALLTFGRCIGDQIDELQLTAGHFKRVPIPPFPTLWQCITLVQHVCDSEGQYADIVYVQFCKLMRATAHMQFCTLIRGHC